MIAKWRSVLCLAPHADDELIGCGGLLMAAVASGSSVTALLACGASVRRAGQFLASVRGMGVLGQVLSWPETRLGEGDFASLVGQLDRAIDKAAPDVIVIVDSGTHQDHETLLRAALASSRLRDGSAVADLIVSESPPRPFSRSPNLYVDVGAFLDVKLRLFEEVYADQAYNGRTAAALRLRAEMRGAEVGLSAAEAFELGRMVVR